MSKRIALYWHNGRSLGHTVRSATLGQALLEHLPGSSVVGITGASKGLELLPPGMDFVKVPSYLTYDSLAGARATSILTVAQREFQQMRANLIATFVSDFRPDALIIDYRPEGKDGELVSAITNSPRTRKVLGLRGILGTPEETNNEFFSPRIADFIREHFSAIHAYVDPRVLRLEEYYEIPSVLLDMLRYTGYITRPAAASKFEARALLQLDQHARIIVVSFGGGQGTEEIWQSVLHGLAKIGNRFDHAYCAAGSYLEADAYERLHAQVAQHPNWHWTRLLDPLPLWMQACDLFIGSGGYNSLSEVIATGTNALIIPRQLKEREQALHSQRLAELNVLRVVDLEAVLSTDITSLLEMCLAEPCSAAEGVQIATDGALQNARLIEALLL